MVFDKSLLYIPADRLDIRRALAALDGTNAIDRAFGPDHQVWPELNDAMNKAYDEWMQAGPAYEFGILSCLFRMMTLLLRLYGQEPPNGVPDADDSRRLKPAIDYMEKHFARKVYIEAVSRSVNMSPYHFSRLFKRTFGLPPVRYLTRIRVEQAKRLLIRRDMPITEVAERCGFCNLNYFDKVFKEQCGFTPLEYRKRFVPGREEARRPTI
ncbi:hypothetical protein DLM86_00225 [Paenibacillus flagellatus]|uniref:HTH araC/xylS-type domain-containing protein n=2 Tax=Paenibacillus flagellatus TaxID=2211139 RepID=A0A2V5KD27_9BACL|nr:hypothetical protein DLM86_00225 [Paenibacillus flagellatus]